MQIEAKDIWSQMGDQCYTLDRNFNTGHGLDFKELPTLNVIGSKPLINERDEESETVNDWLAYAKELGFGRVLFTSLTSTVNDKTPHYHDMANRFLRTALTIADEVIIGWGDSGETQYSMVDWLLAEFEKKHIDPKCIGVDSLLQPFEIGEVDEETKLMVYPIKKFQDPDYDPENDEDSIV